VSIISSSHEMPITMKSLRFIRNLMENKNKFSRFTEEMCGKAL
jgi:hypothetical protein